MRPKISIIIPVYNTEKFLRECILSVQRQTIQDFEILLINDGSTDNSKQVILELAKSDKRIHYFYQENSGAGIARNLGLEKAVGEYIAFLDSDDYYYEKMALEKMIHACEEHKMSICGSYRIENIDGKFKIPDFFNEVGEIPINGKKVSFLEYQNDFFYQSYIYSGDLIRDNDLKFPPYRRYQDPPFLLRAMDIAKEFWVVPTILHCYRKGHQDRKKNQKYVGDTLKGIKDNLLISEVKYRKIFEKSVWRVEVMYYQAILDNWTREVAEVLYEINEIYRRNNKDNKNLKIMDELP